jgi:hypothetical protein
MDKREQVKARLKAETIRRGGQWTPQHEEAAEEFVNSIHAYAVAMVEKGFAKTETEAIEMFRKYALEWRERRKKSETGEIVSLADVRARRVKEAAE